MPYRRRTYRRRRPTGNKSRKWTNAVKRVVNKQLETKHHRVLVEGGITTAGAVEELNTVDSQGVASGQFIGQEIRQVFLRIRGKLTQADSSNVVRVVVFRPTTQAVEMMKLEGSGITDFFYNPGGALYSAWKRPWVDQVYYDRTRLLNMAAGQNDHIALLDIKQRLGGLRYKFDETGTGSTTKGSQSIMIGFISDSALTPNPTYEIESVLYYKDG